MLNSVEFQKQRKSGGSVFQTLQRDFVNNLSSLSIHNTTLLVINADQNFSLITLCLIPFHFVERSLPSFVSLVKFK